MTKFVPIKINIVLLIFKAVIQLGLVCYSIGQDNSKRKTESKFKSIILWHLVNTFMHNRLALSD